MPKEHHTPGGKVDYMTSKTGDGVKDPSASGFASMKSTDGGKTSITYNNDGTATRQRSGGGFSFGLGLGSEKSSGKTTK